MAGRIVVRYTGLAAARKNTVYERMFGQNRLAVDKANAVWYHERNKKLSYCREIALQGALVLAKSGSMGLGYDILQTLQIDFQPL